MYTQFYYITVFCIIYFHYRHVGSSNQIMLNKKIKHNVNKDNDSFIYIVYNFLFSILNIFNKIKKLSIVYI